MLRAGRDASLSSLASSVDVLCRLRSMSSFKKMAPLHVGLHAVQRSET